MVRGGGHKKSPRPEGIRGGRSDGEVRTSYDYYEKRAHSASLAGKRRNFKFGRFMPPSSSDAYRRGVTTLRLDLPHRFRAARSRMVWPHQVRHSTVPACVATLVVHLLLVRRALGPDEGGFSVIARHWTEPGAFLYGPLWVDRPPALIALFGVADQLGPWGPRLVVTGLAVALVALVGRVAEVAGGPSAAPWAAWTAFGLGSSVLLQAQQLNGEFAAVVCVAAAILMLLRALDQPIDRAWMYGTGAGAAAMLAVLMKQNFLDGFVFAALLLGGIALTDPPARRRAGAVGIGVGLGTGLVGAATFIWARAHGGLGPLVTALYGFRLKAALVLDHGPRTGPDQRVVMLMLVALASGLLLLGLHLLWQGRQTLLRRNPLAWALAGTASFDLVSLVGGGNFWPHYAIAFIPVVAVSAGLAARHGWPGWARTRRLVALVAVSAALISPLSAVLHGPGTAWRIGHWVSQSSRSDDSIVVTYTHPNIVEASGLRPAYPYLWSLPIRTLDPHLATLTAALESPNGPTWVVIWDRHHSWGLDGAGQLDRALASHYQLVAHVCRHPVWLRSDTTRDLAPLPSTCDGGAL